MSAAGSGRLTYVGAGQQSIPIVEDVDVPFSEYASSGLGIPDATASATAFNVDFGTVASATALLIKNTNNQEMKVTIPDFDLVPGGVILIIQPAKPTGNPLNAVTIHTTATQVGAGLFETTVLGDP